MNWVVMPYLDCEDYTERALQDCLAQSLRDVAVLLVDNGSKDDSFGRKAALLPHVYRWRYDPPLPSLSATWNAALQFVWEAGGEHAWVVNNDVRLNPMTYHLLLEAQRQTQAWFVTGVGVNETQFEATREPGAQVGDLTTRGGPDFSCYLITRECHRWFQFDEQFIPAYHEDNDYHRRLQLAGLGEKIFGVNVPFLHYGSATIQRSAEAMEAFSPRFERCRNYYVQKWGGLPGYETYMIPFRDRGLGMDERSRTELNHISKTLLTGQGRPGYSYDLKSKPAEVWPWDVRSISLT